MLEPWNDASILSPPVNMFLCKQKFDVSALRHVFNNVMKILSKQSPLHKESAICSRFLYKYDKKFRNDIGYRNLRKVNTALKKYLTLNLLKHIEDFRLALPSEKDDELYLPTRQMLEFVILRVIAFSKLMLRICVCSKRAAVFYLHRIKRGESHWMSLLPYALLSRLWSMSMVLLQHSSTWYTNMCPYLNKLELKGLTLLPDHYKLPENLEEMLDIKNIDNHGKFEWAQKKYLDIENSLMDDDENELFENILQYVNQEKEVEEETDHEGSKPLVETQQQDEILLVPNVTKVDHGVALSRASFKALLNSNKELNENNAPPPKKVSKHSIKNVTNSNTLKQFITTEETYRNESNSNSLTSHLSLMQWHALKNSLLKLCDSLTNRKIEKKLHKIWKQKCLDYTAPFMMNNYAHNQAF